MATSGIFQPDRWGFTASGGYIQQFRINGVRLTFQMFLELLPKEAAGHNPHPPPRKYNKYAAVLLYRSN